MAWFVVSGLALLAAVMILQSSAQNEPSASSDFVKCLSEKNVRMFGFSSCSSCDFQKRMFGENFNEVTYVDCSSPGSKGQTEYCAREKIKSYPTWEISGKKIMGELSLSQLSSMTDCKL